MIEKQCPTDSPRPYIVWSVSSLSSAGFMDDTNISENPERKYATGAGATCQSEVEVFRF